MLWHHNEVVHEDLLDGCGLASGLGGQLDRDLLARDGLIGQSCDLVAHIWVLEVRETRKEFKCTRDLSQDEGARVGHRVEEARLFVGGHAVKAATKAGEKDGKPREDPNTQA